MITVIGPKYAKDGVISPALTMIRGHTYVFDTRDVTNTYHPLSLRNPLTLVPVAGVVVAGTRGTPGSTTTITVAADATDWLGWLGHG